MFFGKRGENKISLWDRKESPVCLRAFPTPQPSGTHGNHGLLNLVPGSLRIRIGILITGQPLLLIRLQNVHLRDVKNDPNAYHTQEKNCQTLSPLQPTQEHSHGRDGNVSERSTEVRLL